MKRHSRNPGTEYALAVERAEAADAKLRRAMNAWLKANRALKAAQRRLDQAMTLEHDPV